MAFVLYCLVSLLYWACFYLPLPLMVQPLITLLDFAPRWLVFLPGTLVLLPWFKPKKWSLFFLVTLLNIFWVLDVQLNIWPSSSPNQVVYRFATFNAGSGMAKPEDILQWYQQQRLDALLLQESAPRALQQALPDWLQLDCHSQLCLLTHHSLTPVRQLNRRPLHGYGYYASHYELTVDGTRFQLINVHLNTPRHGLELLAAPRSNYRRFMRFHEDKTLESMIASQLVQPDTNKVIIGGDFNLTQQSRIYRQYWQRWDNSFQRKGLGLGHTKHTRLLGARIDHILISNDLLVISSQTHPAMGSDHKPVMIEVSIK